MENDNIDFTWPNFDEIKAKLLKKLSNNQEKNNLKFKNSILFKNFSFSNLNFKNHLCFINLNDDMFYDFGVPNDKFFEFYKMIASSNVGLIVTGGVYCDDLSKVKNSASSINIDSKDNIDKHRELVSQVHIFGSKIFLQLKPIFGRGDKSHLFANIIPFSASYNKSYINANMITFRISDSKCNEIVENFKKLAEFSQKANYDGIMINGDSYNILGELSSKEFNKRVFGYYSNIYDMPLKIINKISSISKNIPIIYSLTINTFFNDIYKNNAKNINSIQKNTIKTAFTDIFNFMKKLVEFGVDGFVLKFGSYETEFMTIYNEMQSDDLYYGYYSAIRDCFENANIKNKFGEKVAIIYTDNLTTLKNSTNYINSNLIDFIDITRQLYSDELYIKNLMNDIISNPCIKCGFCNQMARQGKLKCLVNPTLLNKNNFKQSKLKVAVIGAGTSGIVCANYIAERNISVDLYELNEILNKNGRICEIFNFDEYIKTYNDYIESCLYKNINANKINLFLNTRFKIEQMNDYDAIVVATGFKEKFLTLNGSVLRNVKSIYEALSNKEVFNNAEKIVIYAQSELSIKFAIYLSNSGKNVTLIFPNFNEIKQIYNDRYSYYFYLISNLKIKILIDAKVKKINQDFVDIIINSNYLKQQSIILTRNLYSNIKYKNQHKLISVDMDLFIYEPELKSNNKLYYDIVSSGYGGQVFMIGNALQISNLSEIISSAYFVAKNL